MSLGSLSGEWDCSVSLECISKVIHGFDSGTPRPDLGFRPRHGSEIEKHRTSVPSVFFEPESGRSVNASHRGLTPGLGRSTGASKFNSIPEDFDAPPH